MLERVPSCASSAACAAVSDDAFPVSTTDMACNSIAQSSGVVPEPVMCSRLAAVSAIVRLLPSSRFGSVLSSSALATDSVALLLSIVRKRQEKQAADRAGDSDHHEDHNHQ